MISNKRNDHAISPIIGVILMVAITVILAAIIASYIFGSSGNIQKTRVVAATAKLENSGSIQIVYNGGQDDNYLRYISIISPNGTAIFYTSGENGELTLCPVAGCNTVSDQMKPKLGSVMKLIPPSPTDWPDSQKHVIVTGSFLGDDASQIILDALV